MAGEIFLATNRRKINILILCTPRKPNLSSRERIRVSPPVPHHFVQEITWPEMVGGFFYAATELNPSWLSTETIQRVSHDISPHDFLERFEQQIPGRLKSTRGAEENFGDKTCSVLKIERCEQDKSQGLRAY
jgi:hypothetical protein